MEKDTEFIERFRYIWLGWKDKSDVYVLLAFLNLFLLCVRTGVLTDNHPLVPVKRVSVPVVPHWSFVYDFLMIILSLVMILITPRSRSPLSWSKKLYLLFIPPLLCILSIRILVLAPVAIASLIGIITTRVLELKRYDSIASGIALVSIISIILVILDLITKTPMFRYNLALYFFMYLQRISHVLLVVIFPLAIIALVSIVTLGVREKRETKTDKALLLLSVITGLLMYMIPYTRVVNPNSLVATTDIPLYSKILEIVNNSGDPYKTIMTGSLPFMNDRPLYLLILYGIHKILGTNPTTTATISGWIWTPLVIVGTWLLAKQMYDSKTAVIASFLTATTYQTLAFVYGGLQANQLNLAILFLTMALFVKPTIIRALCGLLLLAISVFIHPWSWLQIAPAIIVWLFINPYMRSIKRKTLILLITLVSLLVLFSISTSLEQTTPSVLQSFLRTVERNEKTSMLDKMIGLRESMSIYLWGTLSNPILLLLSLIGTIILTIDRKPDISLIIISLTIPAIIMVSPDWTLVSRLIINIPLQLQAAYALSRMNEKVTISLLLYFFSISLYYSINAAP